MNEKGIVHQRNMLADQNVRLKEEIIEYRAALAWFVDRVERGEVRSSRSYKRFKDLLDQYDSP